ncbi:MAG: zinc ribbon domain-containing protein [Thermoplasmata archaeon]
MLLVPLLFLCVPAAAVSGSHYTPQSGDSFHYSENIELGSGTGNYSGYTESTFINGTESVTAIADNGTESATYSYTAAWSNSTGSSENWQSSGDFTFSSATYRYLQGTDNQTGYSNPFVWFYMNNSLTSGNSFFLLNTKMNVVSTDYSYGPPTMSGKYFRTLFTEGNGSYQRNDVYGTFDASYNWQSFFDPSTGYIVGYVYSEQDQDGTTSGFTLTDSLAVTSTSYALTPAAAPPASSSGGGLTNLEIAIIAIVVLIVIIVVIYAVVSAARRRGRKLPEHSARGSVTYNPPPTGVPPPINLTPSGQPAVQQIVMRETVKVNCRYCGTLIDSTDTVCPKCGAPRT